MLRPLIGQRMFSNNLLPILLFRTTYEETLEDCYASFVPYQWVGGRRGRRRWRYPLDGASGAAKSFAKLAVLNGTLNYKLFCQSMVPNAVVDFPQSVAQKCSCSRQSQHWP